METFLKVLLRSNKLDVAIAALGLIYLAVSAPGMYTFAGILLAVSLLAFLSIAEVLALAFPFLLSDAQRRAFERSPILIAKLLTITLGILGIAFARYSLVVVGILSTAFVVGAIILFHWAKLVPAVLRGKVPTEAAWFADRRPDDCPSIVIYCATHGQHATNLVLSFLIRLSSAGIHPIVIVRRPDEFISLARQHKGLVWFAPTIAFLDKAILPEFETMLYLANDPLNGHAIRFSRLRHILVADTKDYENSTGFDATHALYDHILFENAAVAERLTQSARPDIAGLVEVVEDSAKYLAGEQT